MKASDPYRIFVGAVVVIPLVVAYFLNYIDYVFDGGIPVAHTYWTKGGQKVSVDLDNDYTGLMVHHNYIILVADILVLTFVAIGAYKMFIYLAEHLSRKSKS